MTRPSLLPANATRFEDTLSLATDMIPRVKDPIDAMRGIKYVNTPPSLLPFLIYEYGLEELRPYVPNLYALIREGIAWQRVRGTAAALERGLSWLDYEAGLEEAPVRRKRWHLFQLHLDRVRDNEEPDLDRIDGIATLSACFRSVFYRGFHGYDARALELGYSRVAQSILSDDSGVRLRQDGAKWSFGRVYDLSYTLSQVELQALGIWIEPAENEAQPLGWGELTWSGAGSTWTSPAAQARRRAMCDALEAKSAWLELIGADDQVIGYRRARVSTGVLAEFGGPYSVDGIRFAPDDLAEILYVEFLTGFGDGAGETAARCRIVFDGAPVDPDKPGLAWVSPAELAGLGAGVAQQTITIKLGRTVRERFRFVLRF